MADLYAVTAPLMIRLPAGEKRIMAERFPHPRGLLYFEPFWHLAPPDERIHLIEGQLAGDGPWKIGGCVVHVLACHGTDFCLASEFDAWRQYLLEHGDAYPAPALIASIARRHGAVPAQ